MRNVIAAIATASLLVLSSAALAQTDQTTAPSGTAPAPTTTAAQPSTTAAPTTTSPSADSDLDRVVCRQGEVATGSRLGATRTCHTQRQWNDIQRQSQEQLSRDQINRGMPAGH